MSVENTARIPVVPYNPNDFALGKVLGEPHRKTLTAAEDIGAALSLYFQWEEHHNCYLLYGPAATENAPCALSYDTDEAFPTEVRVLLPGGVAVPALQPGAPLALHFEVFHVSYQCNTTVLAAASPEDGDDWHFIVAMPSEIVVQKARQMPRHVLSREESQSLSPATWTSRNAGTPVDITLAEMSADAVLFQSSSPISGEGTLTFANLAIPAHVVRSEANTVIVALLFPTAKDFGAYFDVFRRFAFPTLRPRRDLPAEAAYQAYDEAGYLSKFLSGLSDEGRQQFVQQLNDTWAAVNEGHHETTADYLAVDQKTEKPVGASSATLAFYNGTKPVWILQQLACVASPEYMRHTRDLYLWRAVYLWARPESLDVGVWFDGKSRFMERLWIKFSRHRTDPSPCLWPMTIRALKVSGETTGGRNFESRIYNVGRAKRVALLKAGLFAGASPCYLNASGVLSHVGNIPPSDDLPTLIDAAKQVATSSPDGTTDIWISVLSGVSNAEFDTLPLLVSNRFCYFPKTDMPSVYTSIIHSLAVLERKHREGTMA